MIRCSVCGHENDDLAVVCISCKSYLQTKVDTLDLFQTLWSLIISPRAAFRRIALSRHKNYAFLLSSLLGIALVFTILWFKNLGRLFPNLIVLLLTGLVAGPFVGIAFVSLFCAVMIVLGRLLGGKATRRNTFGVVAYASMPIVLSLVLVFPIEVAIFGLDFFDNNPSPLVIKPFVYVALLGFDSLAVLWSWLLLIEGSIVANGFTRAHSWQLAALVFLLTVAGAYGIRLL
jgi:hypothetical protein